MSFHTLISGPGESVALGSKTTPETLARILGPSSHSWDDGVEYCLEYSTSLGTFSFTFAHCRFLFGPERLKLVTVELNTSRRHPNSDAPPLANDR